MGEMKGWQMTFTEFNKRFESNMTQAPTFKEAYEITEEEHRTLTGNSRYSDYDSFRHIRNRSIK